MKAEDNGLIEGLPQAVEENEQYGKKNTKSKLFLSRRKFLSYFGLVGAGAALISQVPGIKALASETEARSTTAEARRLRRWTMIIDLRKCDGCVGLGKPPQCTQACILARIVPEGQEWIQTYEEEIAGAGAGTFFFPLPCQHCANAPCVNVCPVGATFTTPEGPVLIDQRRCIGCRLCMAACPYDRRFFNWERPALPPQAMFAEYSPETQIPAIKGTVMKCDFCPDRARGGGIPYCVHACPRGAMYYGDLEEDVATNDRQVIKISSFLAKNQAYRYKEELGTKPRVYYIPGHGQDVGRNPNSKEKLRRMDLEWPWRG